MDIILENYLFILYENKWKELVRNGKISIDQLRRIQQYKGLPDKYYVKQLLKDGKPRKAQMYLRQKGIVQSARNWLDGVERGNINIFSKNKAIVSKPFKDSDMSNVSIANKTNVYLGGGVKKSEQGNRIVSDRHEADEVSIGSKHAKKLKLKGNWILSKFSNDEAGHTSDEVLRRERELIRTGKSLYRNKSNISKPTLLIRNKSKEYENLGSKKEILKYDKKELKKKAEALKIFSPENKKLLQKWLNVTRIKKDLQRIYRVKQQEITKKYDELFKKYKKLDDLISKNKLEELKVLETTELVNLSFKHNTKIYKLEKLETKLNKKMDEM